MHFRIAVFQDKLGVTSAYRPVWENLLLQAGLIGSKYTFTWHKSYNHFQQGQLLEWSGNRKTPGFNKNPQAQIKTLNWVKDQLSSARANVALIMDPALFFIVNQNWDQATAEKLRGGFYNMKSHDRTDIMVLVTVPISSINRSMKTKDIAALNAGFADREEFEEHFAGGEDDDGPDDDDEVNLIEWYDPIVVPYGKFCFTSDIFKLGRILRRAEQETLNDIPQITRT